MTTNIAAIEAATHVIQERRAAYQRILDEPERYTTLGREAARISLIQAEQKLVLLCLETFDRAQAQRRVG